MDESRFRMILKNLDYEKISDWEQEFLISVENYFGKWGDLSERQEEIVEEIWRKNI